MAASEESLNALHELTTQLLIESGEATAADLSVARGLLKDNNINCIPRDDNTIGELEKKLQERRANRMKPKMVVNNEDDYIAATETAQFLMRAAGHGG